MQVISSLLELQSYESYNETVSKVFENSQKRIRLMALVHEKLYQADNMATLNMGEYIRDLVNGLIRSQARDKVTPEVTYDIDEDLSLDLDRTIPCGLIINELISNSLEHAFAGTVPEPTIRIEFFKQDGYYTLSVEDNGQGFDEGYDPDGEAETLGMQLIEDLGERQLDGDITLTDENGVRFTIYFPE